jgi:hypothetical protein
MLPTAAARLKTQLGKAEKQRALNRGLCLNGNPAIAACVQ